MAWQGFKAAGPAEVGMDLITGEESPQDMCTVAYGMEEGLRAFYSELATKLDDKEVSNLFARLAGLEVRHKERIYGLYKRLEADAPDMDAFEEHVVPVVMEGGLTTEEFLELNKSAMETIPEVLDMSMTIEAQALDLYLRYSVTSKDKNTKEVLYEISEEEKVHLRYIGDLRDKRLE